MLTLGAPQQAFATLPVITSGNLIVSAGSATATTVGVNSTGLPESLTIAATTPNTVLTWGAFSDGSTNGQLLSTNDTISFNLPNSSSAILNNITGGGASVLSGRINSNGNVYFLNPSGVIISSTAVVNVNGFYLSTITDPSAPSYFYANGTLGVFNSVAQTASAASGIIYVQSGSSITAATGSGQVQLASNYSGAGVTITGNTNAVQSIPTTATSGAVTITINTSNAYTASSTVAGISVESLTSSGNLVINSLGAASTVNASGLTVSQGYPVTGGALQGGNVTIYSNGGNVSSTGIISGGNLIVQTANTTSGSGTINLTNATVGGNTTFVTNNASVTSNSINVTGSTTVTAGNGGSVTLTGDLIGGSPSIVGGAITISDTNPATTTRTLSQISGNAVTVSSSYGLAIASVNANGNLSVTSNLGSVSVGSTATASNVVGAANTVTGNTGATLTNANFTGALVTVAVSTTNSSQTTSANNVSISTVTANGSISASTAGKGTITLSGVTGSSTVASSIIANTNNGSVTFTNVTINKGSISSNAGYSPGTTSLVPSTITLTNVTNNSQSGTFTDIYTTNNGTVAFSNYQSVISGLTINTGSGVGTNNSTGGITGTASTLGGPSSFTTNNGFINVTGLSILGATPALSSSNSMTIISNTVNNNITVAALTDLNVASVTLNTNSNLAAVTTALSLSSTGNLTTGNLRAFSVTLSAGAALNTQNVDATISQNSTLSITSGGDLNTQNFGTIQGPSKSLTLKSTTGNVNLVSTPATLFTYNNNSSAVTLTATTGNVNIASAIYSNGLTITAGNSITENGSGLITNNGISASTVSPSATLSAPTITLVGANNIMPNVTLVNGSNGITLNTASVSTNIATGSNVTGNLSLSSSGSIGIGVSASDTVSVVGLTTLNTFNSIGGSSAVTTAATNANLFGGVNITTNGSTVALGVVGGNNNFGSISISTVNATGGNAQNVNIDEYNVANLGNVTASTLTVNANGILNTSGVVNATSARLNSSISTTTSVASNGIVTTTTTTVPNTITLGTTNPTVIAAINLVNANALTVNSAASSELAITSTNQNLSNLNLVGNGASSLKYTGSGGSVGSVTASTNSGKLTYSMSNDPTTTGSLTTTTGNITASASGSGGLGSISFALNNSIGANLITNNNTYTINNLTSLNTSTASVSVSSNANASSSTSGNLILGNGISLLGSGNVTFNTGNNQNGGVTYAGGISDAGTTGVTINSAVVTSFIGKTISVTSPLNSLGLVQFTSNGSINYSSVGNVTLNGIDLYAGASGANTIQSTTGNITQTYRINAPLATKSPFSFLASSTGNNGVVLGLANTINANPTNVISITASGNSSLINGNDLTLGNTTVFPGLGQTPNSTDVQLNVKATGNISQSSGTSIYVWGNTTLNSTGSTALNGVSLTNGGNNFGALTVLASGNAKLTESATSSYTQVIAQNFTATSTYGDIVTPTINSTIAVSGNSVLKANNISLTNAGNTLSGGNGSTISLTSVANSTIVDIKSQTIIANGSSIGGNLAITNINASSLITDQAGSSGITVGGIASFVANSSSGGINFTGTNDTFSSLIIRGNSVTLFNKGNLVLAPGSVATYAFITATGNITTNGLGGSGFGLLSLISGGNVAISNDFVFTSSLAITAPGTINLNGLSTYVDFSNGSIVPVINGVATNTATTTYTPPNP